MTCRACGATVREDDKFCNACGARLADQRAAPSDGEAPADGTGPVAAARPAGPAASPASPPAETAKPAGGLPAPAAADIPSTRTAAETARPPSGRAVAGESDVTRQLAQMAGDPTPPPMPATQARQDTSSASAPTTRAAAPPDSQPTTQMAGTSSPSSAGAGAAATGRLGATAPGAHSVTTQGASTNRTTGVVPESYTPMAAAQRDDESHPRFRLGLLIFLAIGAAGLAAGTSISDIVSVEPTAGVPAFDTGTWKLNDLGTNNTIAAIIAAGLIVVGGLLACWRVRWGAGLAGGAGLALAGWAALVVGLAEIPLANASLAIGGDQTGQLAAQFTRDIGYWLAVAAGGAGVLVFITSLVLFRRAPGERSLNPWIAALGAAATLVAVAGPLLPRNGATVQENWRSAAGQDLPPLFFVGRAAQLGALAACGVLGFLLVRRYGLGVAIGGFSIVAWMALTSLLELSSAPIGPAVANPGADNYPFPVEGIVADLTPHAATTGGITVAVACALALVVEMAVTSRGGQRRT